MRVDLILTKVCICIALLQEADAFCYYREKEKGLDKILVGKRQLGGANTGLGLARVSDG
jgi:hypothetical protein